MVSVRLMQQVDTEEGGCGKEELILVLVFGLSKNLGLKTEKSGKEQILGWVGNQHLG